MPMMLSTPYAKLSRCAAFDSYSVMSISVKRPMMVLALSELQIESQTITSVSFDFHACLMVRL